MILKFFLCLTLFTFHLTVFAEDFVVFTQPHTGTHLLVQFLEKLTGKEGVWPAAYFNPSLPCSQETFYELASDPEYLAFLWNKTPVQKTRFAYALADLNNKNRFLFLHSPYTPNMELFLKQLGYRIFTIERDPRDTAISALLHCRKFKSGLIEGGWFHNLPFDDQLELIITGTDWTNSCRHLAEAFRGWQETENCCRVNFIHLLGPMGGFAAEDEQLQELRKIASFAGVEASDKELLDIFYQIWGTGYTFHKGSVGIWRSYFNEDHKLLFKEQMADILIELGYETDQGW